jgi:alcohol dehydrogenase (cytochrome c)
MKSLWALAAVALAPFAWGQVQDYKPVTTEMLEHPSPDDWLMYSRTYDAQRYSPLKQIDKQNVGQLRMVWTRGLAAGAMEGIPLVHDGVMYVIAPAGEVDALDATTGDLIWAYHHKMDLPPAPAGGRGRGNPAASARSKAIAIYQDVIIYCAPDDTIVGIDAKTGAEKWSVKDPRGHTSGPIIVDGLAISGGTCTGGLRANCYILAQDALTGKEVWKFYTAQGKDDPLGDTWGGAPEEHRTTSTWGLPGTYDPAHHLLYWGVANPTPNTRMQRHNGNPDAIPRTAPADLFSNSTVALNPATGKLVWYYQHLPGDDWDEDYTHERTLFRTKVEPDPKYVKWINPDIPKGEEHEVAAMVGEGGGVFALDSVTGKFLWATPFPYDTPNFLISNIDGKTGKTTINWSLVFKDRGEPEHTICFFNTRSYWPTAYDPDTNSLYVPYNDNCLKMGLGPGQRHAVLGPHAEPNKMAGIGRIDMSTGQITQFYMGRAATNGSVVATAGGLIFWGDLNRRFFAFDAESGKILWKSILGGSIAVSTITYAVKGKQYVAVLTGDGLLTPSLVALTPDLHPPRGANAVYVFALP